MASGPPRQILLAEDDEAARVMLQRYLSTRGYLVTAVADGQAALDALESEQVFDLVLLDVMMPRRNGLEVLQLARERGHQVPIIMATAAASPEDIVKALGLGADDYVTKPYSFPVLVARIEARMRLRAPPPNPEPPRPPPLPAARTAPEPEKNEEGSGLFGRLKRFSARLRRPAPEQLAPGSKVAERYLIESEVGSGAFGQVFRARHLDLDQQVALKVLTKIDGPGALDQFRREAQSACRVRHPNAVRVFDFGLLPSGSAFLVMELLEGPTLDTVLKVKGRLELEEALTATRAVLSALGAAHKQGLVHRDVKPANVVLHEDDGRQVPKLVDFGLAADDGDWGNEDGAVAGSPAYVSPERIRGEKYDGRADVYSCGVMLYKLLTGVTPIEGDTRDLDHIAVWHLTIAPLPPSTKNPQLSPAVDKVVLQLLAKNPAERPDAGEAESLLDTLLWS